ncbi:MAG: multidrug effflux MFS transporter [Alphaproteobacteria bacterium]|nr:multidrug effflux MFS transporter [Alphaproteobacteria bacterium]
MSDAAARRSLYVLLILTIVSVMSMQIIVPSLLTIAREFGETAADAQLVLTAFLFGYAVFQLVNGPLSDRYGRRVILLTSGGVFAAGSLTCGFATSLDMLVLGRFVQAIGASAVFVIGPAAMRDLFGAEGSARAIGWVAISAGFAAAVAPYVGGIVEEQRNWRWTQFATAALSIAATGLVWRSFGESHPVARRVRAGVGTLAVGYVRLFHARVFALYIVAVGAVNGAFYAFFAGGPFVTIELLGLTPSEFGLLGIPTVIAYMGSAYVAVRLAGRIGLHQTILLGACITLIGCGGAAVLAILGEVSVAILTIGMLILGMGNGFVIPCSIAGGVNAHPKLAGTAAAALGAAQMGVGALTSYLVGALHDGSAMPTVGLMAGMALLAALAALALMIEAKR